MAEFHFDLQTPIEKVDFLLSSLNQWTLLDEQIKANNLKNVLSNQSGSKSWKALGPEQENIVDLLINALEIEVTNLKHSEVSAQSSEHDTLEEGIANLTVNVPSSDDEKDKLISYLLKIFLLFTREGESIETSIIPNISALLRVTLTSDSGRPFPKLEQILVKLIDKRGRDVHLMGLTCRLICQITGVIGLPNWNTDKTIQYPHFFSCITGSEKDKHAVKQLGDIAFYFAQYMKEHRILPLTQSSPHSVEEDLTNFKWIITSLCNSFHFTEWIKNDYNTSDVSPTQLVSKHYPFYKYYGQNSPIPIEVAECIHEYSLMYADHILQNSNTNHTSVNTDLQINDDMINKLFFNIEFLRLSIQTLSTSLPTTSERIDKLINNVLGLYVKMYDIYVCQQQPQQENINDSCINYRLKYIQLINKLFHDTFLLFLITNKIYQEWIIKFNGINILFNTIELLSKKLTFFMNTTSSFIINEAAGPGGIADIVSVLYQLLKICQRISMSKSYIPKKCALQCIEQLLQKTNNFQYFINLIKILKIKNNNLNETQQQYIDYTLKYIFYIFDGYIDNDYIRKQLLLNNDLNLIIVDLVHTYIDNPMMPEMLAYICAMVSSIVSMDLEIAMKFGDNGLCEAIGMILQKYHPYGKDDPRHKVYIFAQAAIGELTQVEANFERLEGFLTYVVHGDD